MIFLSRRRSRSRPRCLRSNIPFDESAWIFDIPVKEKIILQSIFARTRAIIGSYTYEVVGENRLNTGALF